MRLVALSGLLICSLAATLRAANTDADRFLETAKELLQAINSDDSAAIQASFDAQMQQALPPDKAMPFFRGLVTAKGKLKKAGAPQVTGRTAVVRVTAERGAWDFKISLEPSGKIAELLISEAAAKAPAPASARRFTKVANKLIQAINSDESAAIQASFDAQMQQALPPDKASSFFRALATAAGKLKHAGVPQVTGPTAIVRVPAERGALDFKITLDASDKISELYVTPSTSDPAAESTALPRSRTPTQLPFLKEMLADTCRKHNVPSLTIAVVRSDGFVTTECSGVRKRGTDEAVELSDRHPLGSCTKSMTATLAAVEVEAGKIEWDTTISQVWPRADEKHLHPSLHDVTLNELLSHQSGLAQDLKDLTGKDWLSFFEEKASPALERKRLLNLILKLKPEYQRGEYHYSNLGYVVAAAMLEKKCGDSFENMMRRQLFKPLKMDTADFRTMALARKLKAPLLWGHIADGTPIDPRIAGAENPSVYAPCGTVNLSIADYARYAQWHLRHVPVPLLSAQKTLDHLHTGQIDAPSNGGKYGCGWIVLNTGLGRAITHGGTNTNSHALIWILPDKDFAAVACTNTGENSGFLACDEAIQELMKRYAGFPSKD